MKRLFLWLRRVWATPQFSRPWHDPREQREFRERRYLDRAIAEFRFRRGA